MATKWCETQPVITVTDLGISNEISTNNPRFQPPDYQKITAIEPDDWVELTHQGDRFWVTIDIVNVTEDYCEFTGKVRGPLNYNHPFQEGDCILFEGVNILNIHSHKWKNEARVSPNI